MLCCCLFPFCSVSCCLFIIVLGPVHGWTLVVVSYTKGDGNLTLSVSSPLIIPAAIRFRYPLLSISVLLCWSVFTVDVEERTRTHSCARVHNPIYQQLYLPRHNRDVLHSMKFNCLWLPFWELMHSVFYSFPFRGMLFLTESSLCYFCYFVRRFRYRYLFNYFKPWWLSIKPRETATICASPFLSHFSQLLLLLSVCVILCCYLFLFSFLDAFVFFFRFAVQDAVAGSIKSNMTCMQTPCALRLSIGVMCGRSTPYCMCSHPLLTSHDCSLFNMFI